METTFGQVAAAVAGTAAAAVILWYVVYNVLYGVPAFNFESRSWEFPVSPPDMAVSVGIAITITMPAGTSLEGTQDTVKKIESQLQQRNYEGFLR